METYNNLKIISYTPFSGGYLNIKTVTKKETFLYFFLNEHDLSRIQRLMDSGDLVTITAGIGFLTTITEKPKILFELAEDVGLSILS